MSESRGAKVEVVCACGCGVKFMARTADIKRGWGKYASKSCKATAQERETRYYSHYVERQKDVLFTDGAFFGDF